MKRYLVKYHAILRFLERLHHFDITAETTDFKKTHQTPINDTNLVNFLADKYQLNLQNIKQQILSHVGEDNLKIGQNCERDGLVYVVRNGCVITIYPKFLGVKNKPVIDLAPQIQQGQKKSYQKKQNRLQGGVQGQGSKKYNRYKHKLLNALRCQEKTQELQQTLKD